MQCRCYRPPAHRCSRAPPQMSRLPTLVLLACSEAPAVLTLPRGRPDARGKNCRRTVARSLPFFRSWLKGWSVVVGAVMDSIFCVCFWVGGWLVCGGSREACWDPGERCQAMSSGYGIGRVFWDLYIAKGVVVVVVTEWRVFPESVTDCFRWMYVNLRRRKVDDEQLIRATGPWSVPAIERATDRSEESRLPSSMGETGPAHARTRGIDASLSLSRSGVTNTDRPVGLNPARGVRLAREGEAGACACALLLARGGDRSKP